MCEQFLVVVAAVAGVFNRGGSSERWVIGTDAALPSCSWRVLQAALSLLSLLSAVSTSLLETQGPGWMLIHKTQWFKFTKFSSFCKLFLFRYASRFKTTRFAKRKSSKRHQAPTGASGAGSGARPPPDSCSPSSAPRALVLFSPDSVLSAPGLPGPQLPPPLHQPHRDWWTWCFSCCVIFGEFPIYSVLSVTCLPMPPFPIKIQLLL